MELIKENKEKKRSVYFNNGCYRKIWAYERSEWIHKHVKMLGHVMPNFVVGYGLDYIDYKVIPGTTANKLSFKRSVSKTLNTANSSGRTLNLLLDRSKIFKLVNSNVEIGI